MTKIRFSKSTLLDPDTFRMGEWCRYSDGSALLLCLGYDTFIAFGTANLEPYRLEHPVSPLVPVNVEITAEDVK